MPIESVDKADASPAHVDDSGPPVVPADDGRAARSAALRVALAKMMAIPDDPPGSDQEFMRAIDEERPERPLFEGRY